MDQTPREIRIFFFGDSICFGQGVSPCHGWVTRIAADLAQRESSWGCSTAVGNPSINGNTTRMALERMPFDVQQQRPDVLFVQFGMNDCNYWQTDRGCPRVSPLSFEANLKEIIDRGYRFGAQQILLNTNHPTTRCLDTMAGTGLTYQQSNAQYNQIIRDVASSMKERYPITLVDTEAYWIRKMDEEQLDLANLLLPDGLHLSREGHALYHTLCSPALIEACEQLQIAALN